MDDDCPCLIHESDDLNFPTLVTEKIQRARKQYACTECREPIPPGERYEYVKGRWEGEWSTFRTCLGCFDVRKTLLCGGWTYGELWNDLSEADFVNADTPPAQCMLRECNEAGALKLKTQYMKAVIGTRDFRQRTFLPMVTYCRVSRRGGLMVPAFYSFDVYGVTRLAGSVLKLQVRGSSGLGLLGEPAFVAIGGTQDFWRRYRHVFAVRALMEDVPDRVKVSLASFDECEGPDQLLKLTSVRWAADLDDLTDRGPSQKVFEDVRRLRIR